MTAQQLESTDRFLRPPDVERTLRNYRRIQIQRLFGLGRSAAILVAVLIASVALYRHTQSDSRFAVRHVEITGVVHTPRAELQTLTRRYLGMNLFRLDIARVRADLGALTWIKTIEIEKKLPDTLRIRVTERAAVALVERDGLIRYVDAEGVEFAEISPEVGDADLALITNASGADLARCVALIRELRARDPQIYRRISEVRPMPPRGFALFDRQLGAFVYANEEDVFSKWRTLAAVARAEHFSRGEIAYADIRFSDRLVVKPLHETPLPEVSRPQFVPSQITN